MLKVSPHFLVSESALLKKRPGNLSKPHLIAGSIRDSYSTFVFDAIRSICLGIGTSPTTSYRAGALYHRAMSSIFAQRVQAIQDSSEGGAGEGSLVGGSTNGSHKKGTETTDPSTVLLNDFCLQYELSKLSMASIETPIIQAAACVLTSAVLEDPRVHIRAIVMVTYRCIGTLRHRLFNAQPPAAATAFAEIIQQDHYTALRTRITEAQSVFLEQLSLKVHVDTPQKYVVVFLRLICSSSGGMDLSTSGGETRPSTTGSAQLPGNSPTPESVITADLVSGDDVATASAPIISDGGTTSPKVKAIDMKKKQPLTVTFITWVSAAMSVVNDAMRCRSLGIEFTATEVACAAILRTQPADKPLSCPVWTKTSTSSMAEKSWLDAFGVSVNRVSKAEQLLEEEVYLSLGDKEKKMKAVDSVEDARLQQERRLREDVERTIRRDRDEEERRRRKEKDDIDYRRRNDRRRSPTPPDRYYRDDRRDIRRSPPRSYGGRRDDRRDDRGGRRDERSERGKRHRDDSSTWR